MSPHRFDVSNRRNGVATVTRVASNVFREPKALQPIDVDVDVLAGFRQRVEAPGSQSEVDAERQPGVLLAEFVVDHPDDLVPVADNNAQKAAASWRTKCVCAFRTRSKGDVSGCGSKGSADAETTRSGPYVLQRQLPALGCGL